MLLVANGENVKVVQELMRHASTRFTLKIYSQAQLIAKKSRPAALSRSHLASRGCRFPALCCWCDGSARVPFWSDLERRNYPKRLLSYSFYGGHSRIRTYDFHRVNLTKGTITSI